MNAPSTSPIDSSVLELARSLQEKVDKHGHALDEIGRELIIISLRLERLESDHLKGPIDQRPADPVGDPSLGECPRIST